MPLVVVDAANVVGSVPDGWWRDRHGATERLRDALTPLSRHGITAAEAPWAASPPLELVLVVEGAARSVAPVAGIAVHRAAGSGDDAIVELVRAASGRRCLVVTSDRGLAARVRALGAAVAGARTVRPR